MSKSATRIVASMVSTVLILMFAATTNSCATISNPQGGKRDTVPPVIVRTSPELLSVSFDENGNLIEDFNGRKIEIEFDEYYVLKNPSSNIYLSPPTDGELELDQRGKKLRIKMPDSLKEATTYTINFGAAITDLTEGNEQKRFKYVFSTGTFIDSFFVAGDVVDGYLNEPVRDLSVFLYEIDSADQNQMDSIPLIRKPSYFGISDENGQFMIDFVKSGQYLVFAFDDKNSNLLYDRGSEPFAFSEQLVYSDSLPELLLRLSKEELTPKLRNPTHPEWGKMIFPFSSPISNFIWGGPLNSDSVLEVIIPRHSLSQDTAIFYFDDFSQDSLLFQFTINDSIIDTAFVLMRSYDPPESYGFKLSANPYLDPGDSLKISSSRPFRFKNKDLTIFREPDTVGYTPKVQDEFQFSHNLGILYEEPRTSQLIIYPEQIEFLGGVLNPDTVVLEWKTQNDNGYAILFLQVDADWDAPLLLELLDKSGTIVEDYKFSNQLKDELPYLNAGTFSVRILEDLDSNGRWTPGDWFLKRQPEKMYYYEEKIDLKANWEVESTWKVRSFDYLLKEKATEE